MKKPQLIAYTVVVLMIGAIVGGVLNAWAFGRATRVQLGSDQVGIYYESESSILIQAYDPVKIKGATPQGSTQIRILLKK